MDGDVLEAFLRQEPRYLKALDKYEQDGNEVLHKKVDRLIAALA